MCYDSNTNLMHNIRTHVHLLLLRVTSDILQCLSSISQTSQHNDRRSITRTYQWMEVFRTRQDSQEIPEDWRDSPSSEHSRQNREVEHRRATTNTLTHLRTKYKKKIKMSIHTSCPATPFRIVRSVRNRSKVRLSPKKAKILYYIQRVQKVTPRCGGTGHVPN